MYEYKWDFIIYDSILIIISKHSTAKNFFVTKLVGLLTFLVNVIII